MYALFMGHTQAIFKQDVYDVHMMYTLKREVRIKFAK